MLASMNRGVKRFLPEYAVTHGMTTQLVRHVLAERGWDRVGATPEARVGATLCGLKAHEVELNSRSSLQSGNARNRSYLGGVVVVVL